MTGAYYFPILHYYPASAFGQDAIGEPNYRELREHFSKRRGNWVLMPLYPYSPTESLLELPGSLRIRRRLRTSRHRRSRARRLRAARLRVQRVAHVRAAGADHF